LIDSEIERIKAIVEEHANAEVINVQNLNIGSRVRITNGLLLNYQGVVNQIMGKAILMTIEQLNCVIAVKVDIDQISLNTAS
jgi:transcription antitermination factor NusG